jgi:hypothetical protein
MEDCNVTTLDFDGQPPVSTDDDERIATLVRKGWTIRPDVPVYDVATEQCAWVNGEWVVSAIVKPVPQSITPAQGETQLLREGLLDAVRAILANESTPEEMKIAFARASTWERQSPSVMTMMAALKKTDADADAFFTAAAHIKL